MTSRLAIAAPFALLVGCTPGARLDVPQDVLSDGWSRPNPGDDVAEASRPGSLGALLDAPELATLIARALAANPGLRAGEARVAQAAAAVTQARAASLPVVTGSVTAGGLRATAAGGQRFTFGESFAAIDALLPLDPFGRITAQKRAARDRLAAAQLDRDALAITLETQVAVAYVQRATLADRIRLLDSIIAQATELDRVMRIRAREGEATRVDVGLQAIRLTQLRAERTRLTESFLQTRNALAALVGEEAPGFTVGTVAPAELRVPTLAVPSPAALMALRPDVRAAEARVAAAGGDVTAARRAFFPSLTASVGTVVRSSGIGAVNPLGSLTADLLSPIFARSRLNADLRFSAAQQREAVATYRQSVLTALRDVEDALAAIEQARERSGLLQQVEEEATTTSRLARRQYLEGEIDLIQLLDSQDLLISAQDARAVARQELLAATIALYGQTAG